MPELYGPLQHVGVVGSLWLIPLFPLLAAAFCAAWPLWARRAGAARPPSAEVVRHRVQTIAVGAVGLAFLASLVHAVMLARHDEGERFFLQHLWRLVRLGQLDASFDLALDPLSAALTLVVTGVGALIFVYAASYMHDDEGFARFFAWLSLFVFSMLLLVLADNLLLMFFGWEGVGLCSWGLIGFWWRDRRKAGAGMKAFVVNRIGDAGFVLGIAVLFWGLGGSWSDVGDYVPDLNARFASVAVDAAPPDEDDEAKGARAAADEVRPAENDAEENEARARGRRLPPTTGTGLLTLTSYAGAVVYMDDARTPLMRAPGEPLRAPFARFPVTGGIHSFRIHAGMGLDDYLVSHVAMGEGREIALTATGPTVTFRQLRDQLVAEDARGHAPLREALVAKRAWGRVSVLTLACLLLFVGAAGKSAQIPLYVWLPDAMAGPTPVSALIHAATMVTAGVYLIARLSFLFALSHAASTVVATIGAATALVAATIGFFQYDMKRVLAYSTVSQLGYMMLAVGVGGYAAGVFHLITHAFFKACLFLAAGSVIHGMEALYPHDEDAAQDLRNMGGLAAKMPKTARAYRLACLAMTAAPIPGLAGFWSKDDILVAAFTVRGTIGVPAWLLGAIALVAAGCTSFYVWRSYYLAFEGEARAGEAIAQVHESPAPMTGVLGVLAALSVVSGAILGIGTRLVGRGGPSLLEEWLEPVLRDARGMSGEAGVIVEWSVIAAAYGVALAGWAIAKRRYGAARPRDWEAVERRAPLYTAIANRYWVDAVYDRTFAALTLRLRTLLAEIDRWVIDGLVNGAALLTRAVAWIVGKNDEHVVDGAVAFVAEGTLRAGERVRAVQTGRVQSYVYAIVAGVLALAILQYVLR